MDPIFAVLCSPPDSESSWIHFGQRTYVRWPGVRIASYCFRWNAVQLE